ncbi:c-type cytochrome [Thiocystis violacea]|uniref:c-type cytochrome n=1 Tax=Thiocystis violacea TaxID=13725 RepID=UPI0019058FCE|nr:c-type cytochrome [Thiocystis violacea]MBK1720012.1 hypothetical protein [Thiocystis violacea]
MNRSIKQASLALGFVLLLMGRAADAEYLKTFEGWKVYNSSCILCHGPQGRGDGSLAKKLGIEAADFRERRQKLDGLSDQALLDTIKGGRGHLRDMPKWRDIYPDTQLAAAIAYIRYLSGSSHPLEANPVEGQQYYQLYCIACHGKTGKGDGFMTSLLEIKPADHTNTERMDRLTNQQMGAMIKSGKGMMPAWKGILDDQDIAELVTYIRLLSHPSGR